jgi:hypothetical protein
MNQPFQVPNGARAVIFVNPPASDFFKLFDEISQGGPQELSVPLNAFRRNLQNTMETASLPYYLVTIDLRHFTGALHLLLTGEKADFEDADEIETDATARRLSQLATREDIRPSLVVHLRQSTVLLWGAFEAFAKDMFIALLNTKPDLIRKLVGNQITRNMFDLKTLRFDEVIDFNYNLANKMGDLLIQRRAIDNVVIIKDVFTTILPSDELLSETLSDHSLRILNQRRHLIVHRGSLVDQEYIEKTGETLPERSELIVTANEFNSYLYSVLEAGTILAYGAKSIFMPQRYKLVRAKPNSVQLTPR